MTEHILINSTTLPEAGSYHDLRALNSLRNLAQHDEQAALKAAVKQFESLFLQQVLKSMRDANEVFEDDDFFGGGDNDLYQQMHDEQLALSLANKQSLGLADLMVQQLSKSAATAPAAGSMPADVGHSGFTGTLPARPPLRATQHGEFVVEPPTPEAFVQSVLPHAENAAQALAVDPVLLVAQAALETGWGSRLPVLVKSAGSTALPPPEAAINRAGSSHQYFGIKADGRWTGKTALALTLEFLSGPGQNGLPVRRRASFRAYDSVADAFADYVSFIKSSPRYQDAVAKAADPAAYANGLQQAGYATDPNYAAKLMQLFNSENLRACIAQARKLL